MANWRSDRETVHFFCSTMGHFRRLRTIKEEGVSRGFDVELHIPPLASTPPKSLFFTGILA